MGKARSPSVVRRVDGTSPATLCRPSGGDDYRRHRRHGVDCQQGTMALSHEGSEMPEHTAGIRFSPELATSGVRGVTS